MNRHILVIGGSVALLTALPVLPALPQEVLPLGRMDHLLPGASELILAGGLLLLGLTFIGWKSLRDLARGGESSSPQEVAAATVSLIRAQGEAARGPTAPKDTGLQMEQSVGRFGDAQERVIIEAQMG